MKPTTIGTNYKDILDLDGVKTEAKKIPATLLPAQELARWAHGLRHRLALAIVGSRMGETPMACKLTPAERELWRKHLENDHQPYRADCAVCVNAQAVGRPHPRVPRPSSFTMAIDIAGPFKHKGSSMDFRDYRYLMVGAVRFPKSFLQVLDSVSYDKELLTTEVDEGLKDQEEPVEDKVLQSSGECDNLPEWRDLFGDTDDPPLARDDPEFWSEVDDEAQVSMEVEGHEPPVGKASKSGDGEKDDMDKKVEELKRPVEMTTVYICRPLRRRTGPAVLTALHVQGQHSCQCCSL